MTSFRSFCFLLALIPAGFAPALFAQESIFVSAHVTPELGQQALAECSTEMNGVATRANYPGVPTTCHIFQSNTELTNFSCNADPNNNIFTAHCSQLFTTTSGQTYVIKGTHNITLPFTSICDAFGGAFLDTLGYVSSPAPDFLESTSIAKNQFLALCLRIAPVVPPTTFSMALTHSNPLLPTSVSPKEVFLAQTQQQNFTSNKNATWTLDPSDPSTAGSISTQGPATTVTYSTPNLIDVEQTVTPKACDVNSATDCDTATIHLSPLSVTVSPVSIGVLPTHQVKFIATVTGPPIVDQGVVWSRDPAIGTIASDGSFAAPVDIQAPATVTIRATSNVDKNKTTFGTATAFVGPVTITVSGPGTILASAGAQQTYSATVISPANTDLTWTVPPQNTGTITPIPSSTQAIYSAPSPVIQTVTTSKIQACLTADTALFCGSQQITLSPPVIIASITPNTWPSGQSTPIVINGSGLGTSAPTVTMSDPLIHFTLTSITNNQIQGTVDVPPVASQEFVTLTVTSSSNPINSSATSGPISVTPVTVTVTLFPTAATLSETQQQLFNITINCKTATSSPCSIPSQFTCSIIPSRGIAASTMMGCTYQATATVTGPQPVPVQMVVRSTFNSNVSATATITLTPLNVTVAPTTASVNGGLTQKFTATVTGAPPSNTGVTWSLVRLQPGDPAPVGVVDQTGLYTAPNPVIVAQTFAVQACTVADTNVCGQSQVSLVPVSVTVSPLTVSLSPGGTQQFTTVVLGTSNTAVTWSLVPSIGTIRTTGLYTAPSVNTVQQTVTVRACTVAAPNPCNTATVTLLAAGAPVASLSPNPLVFNEEDVGRTSTGTITLTNTGTVPLLFSGASIPDDPADFAQTNNCPASLAAAASCTFTVVFAPTKTGPLSATLKVTDNALGGFQTVGLTGSGRQIFLSPTSLSFPYQTVGTPSAAQVVTLHNVSSTPLSNIAVCANAGCSGSGEFMQTNNCGTSLPANGSCTISVIFQPISEFLRSGTLTVTDSAATSPQTAALSGLGQFPPAVVSNLSPAQVTAGSSSFTLLVNGSNFQPGISTVSVNGVARAATFVSPTQMKLAITSAEVTTAGQLTITASNPTPGGGSGTGLLSITNNLIPLISNILPARVIAGFQSPVKLIVNGSFFAPDSIVQINGSNRITSFISSTQLTATLPISDFAAVGFPTITVTSPSAAPTATSINLAVFKYGDVSFNGSVDTVDLVTVSNTLAGNITLADSTPGDLNLDASLTISDLITLSNFLAGNIHLLPVIPDGSAYLFNAGAPVAANPITFGGQIVGTASDLLPIALTNGGPNTTLSITNVTVTGDFVQTNSCISLAPNQSCTVFLKYVPTAAGAASGLLTVQDNSLNSPHTAVITGLGIDGGDGVVFGPPPPPPPDVPVFDIQKKPLNPN